MNLSDSKHLGYQSFGISPTGNAARNGTFKDPSLYPSLLTPSPNNIFKDPFQRSKKTVVIPHTPNYILRKKKKKKKKKLSRNSSTSSSLLTHSLTHSLTPSSPFPNRNSTRMNLISNSNHPLSRLRPHAQKTEKAPSTRQARITKRLSLQTSR